MKPCLAVLAAAAFAASCSGPLVRPTVAPAAARADALLILPGFGYGRDAGKVFTAISRAAGADGIDVYVAPFVTRAGLDDSRAHLEQFVRDERLDRYEHLHVFAFIAGAWTLNPMLDRGELPNLTTIVYDRSPYQERAPRVAATKLPKRAWLRYGKTIFDVARTPYPAIPAQQLAVGLLVESVPTPFIVSHAKEAASYGPLSFACDSLGQRHDDCAYLPMHHTDMYARFADVWPDVHAFIRTGRFTAGADRTPPADTILATVRR